MPSGLSVDIRSFMDPSRDLTFDEVLALDASRFEPARRTDFNLGYTSNAVWLRLAITSDRDRAAVLSLVPNYVDLIDIHVGQARDGLGSRDFSHVATGDHRPLPSNGVSSLDDATELSVRAKETTLVYIRLAAIGSALAADIRVYPKEDRPKRQATAILAIGAWFGSMVVLIVISIVFFYYDRKLRYLLLALSTAMTTCIYIGTLGLSRLFMFSQGGFGNDIFLGTSIWLGLTASGHAAIQILELRENSPRLYRVFLLFCVLGLIGAVFGLAGLHPVFAPFGSLASIILATLAAFQGLRTANAGGNATRLRAAAYGILWVGVVTVMLQRMALVGLPNWAAHVYAVACVLQTILLTGALGVRLRDAENLNLAMQRQALLAAQEAEEHANTLVDERTRELAAARQTAEDALRAELASQQQQVRFMEVISHQSRTPLAVIRTYIDNIGFSLAPSDDANRSRLDRVRKGVQRLVEVLEVNLSRARLQGSSFRPVLTRVLAAEIVEAAAARGRDLLQAPILTELSADAAVARVQADADMFGLAIINLLENAAKFSRSKGREPILLSCRIEDGKVLIAVTDKGIGIPAEDMAGIFDATRRGTNAVGIEGAGMGLSLVARIASAHDGSVRAESVEGEGTTMTISLPIQAVATPK